jgi:dienelactone hydrolase
MRRSNVNIATEMKSYQLGGTGFTGMFASNDAARGRRPGVLVIHGGAGLDDHAKGRARQIAKWGLLAFACDMYGDGVAGNRERVMARIAELRADRSRLCDAANAGLRALATHRLVDGRLAAVGYCFGGMTVLEMARGGAKLRGVASIHGSLSTDRPLTEGAVEAKILVCHGALDPHIPMAQVGAFAEEMNRCKADWQLNIYGRALHGFTHEKTSGIPGVAYDASADARSSKALRDFLAEIFA